MIMHMVDTFYAIFVNSFSITVVVQMALCGGAVLFDRELLLDVFGRFLSPYVASFRFPQVRVSTFKRILCSWMAWTMHSHQLLHILPVERWIPR